LQCCAGIPLPISNLNFTDDSGFAGFQKLTEKTTMFHLISTTFPC